MKPFIVLVGGAYSGCGKTTFLAELLRRLGEDWAAIKYTKTGLYSSIVEHEEILSHKGKDTSRYIEAGAKKVLWIQCPKETLKELLSISLERLSGYKGIIIEGNSPIEFLKPDVVVFLDGDERPLKPSARKVKERAHIVTNIKEMQDGLKKTEDLISKKESLIRELTSRAVDKRITCRALRELAQELGVNYKEAGEAADSLGIKITNCELGCF